MNSTCLIFWFAVSVFYVPFKNQWLVAGKKTACLPYLDYFATGLWQQKNILQTGQLLLV